MAEIKVSNFSSVSIVHNPDGDEFLFHFYDEGYPRPAYRGRAKLIGGNRDSDPEKNISPRKTLEVELREEFDPEEYSRNPGIYAHTDVIKSVRSSLLSRIQLYKDFILTVAAPPKEGQTSGFEFTVLTSVFSAELDKEIFRLIEQSLMDGKRLSNEGILRAVTADELRGGKVQFAWDSGAEAESYMKNRLNLDMQGLTPEDIKLHGESSPIRDSYLKYSDGVYGGHDVRFTFKI